MPIYEYECQSCGDAFELQRKFSDPPLETCLHCGKGPVEKLISRSSFALKGSGWYQTDFAGEKPSKPAADACGSSGSKPACAGCPVASE